LLKIALALREDVGPEVGQACAQVGEPLGPEQQLAHDEQRPSLPNHVQCAGDPARIAVCALAGHRWKFIN
jgi:hypothetical protein